MFLVDVHLLEVHLLVLVIKEVSGGKQHGPPGGVSTLGSIATQDNIYHKIGSDIKPRRDRGIRNEEWSRHMDLEVGFILLPKLDLQSHCASLLVAQWDCKYIPKQREAARREAAVRRRGK